MQRPSGIVFVGPSLARRAVHQLMPTATVLGPARRGDIISCLADSPTFIALIDGVFGWEQSVWHKEILCALAIGVKVFGAASMGALRAAELASSGMIGCGLIYRWYADEKIDGDAEVAILHAPSELEYTTLSISLVDLRYALCKAVVRRILTRN